MHRALLLAASLMVAFGPCAMAQFTAGGGQHGYQNGTTWGNQYGPSGHTGKGKTTNRLFAPDIPHLSSQAATGMPIVGTYIAPTNLALRNQGWFVLPPTNLDSFVAQSGYDFNIYGDEGEDDIPPLFVFSEEKRIERGIERSNNSTLTTGHRSDAPEAWGWPF
jgi:hypothetical protein